MDDEYKLVMKDIRKSFGGVKALSGVSLKVKKGEIHALLGENGAGKSTLMKVLSGAYKRDSGEIFIDGKPVRIENSKDSKENGIAVIYQELMLAPDLTVAENIFIDNLAIGSKNKGLVNWKKLRREAEDLLHSLGFDDINPNTVCRDLSVAYQQVVEICKNLSRNASILVLDEPTSVLTFKETEHLFEILEQLRDKGISIIYISHRLEEIFRICDTITVLKDGAYVGDVKVGEIDKKSLVNMMVGREMTDMYPKQTVPIGDVVLKAEHIVAGNKVNDVSFEVRAGEILGFSVLVGAGRTETMRAIFGADKMDSGKVTFLGEEVRFSSPRDAVRKKLGMLSEDRKSEGLLLNQSIRVNTTITCLDKASKNGIFNHRAEKKYVKELLQKINTKYASTEDNVDSLSGGNQQKVSVAKWIAADCRCIIFDEPTRGVDVGAKTEIYKLMNDCAANGVAVIMISSEMPEIIGMCDRVIIMSKGRITGMLSREELTESNLIQAAMEV